MIDSSFDLPGWSTAVDPRSGRQYYINLLEKTTTWEDPRPKYKPIHIPMQPLHGSPKNVQIYPTQNYPVQAFQSYPGQSVNASPIPSTKTTSHHSHHTVEMSSLSRSSPHTPRIGSLIKNHQQLLQQQQQTAETSFSNPTPIETDATVAKINTMFPTASEHHIRLLLKKYLKSMFPKAEETIILDVLANVENNVQKASEQLKSMGYDKKEMTPAPRLSHRKKEENQPKKEMHIEPTPPPKVKTSEEKKKLKQRLQSQYKDSIPEKIISMALESVDYSEEKALRILDIVLQEDKDSKKKSEKDKKKTEVEKNVSFKEPNKGIDLESAAAIENDENMIINSDHSIITTPIDGPQTSSTKSPERNIGSMHDETSTSEDTCDAAVAEKNKRHRPKARSESNRSEKNILVTKKDDKSESKSKSVAFEGLNDDEKFLSIITMANAAKGPNANLAKGPKDELLLTDYVTWNGANPDIIKGHRIRANGPNSSLRIDRHYTPIGRSSELCKGPKVGLAKGSIYSQMNRPNVIGCN